MKKTERVSRILDRWLPLMMYGSMTVLLILSLGGAIDFDLPLVEFIWTVIVIVFLLIFNPFLLTPWGAQLWERVDSDTIDPLIAGMEILQIVKEEE